ncbi:Kelch repeat-containing protein [Amycolatopsis anabasis]|uniref:Kelch repeat-containing protein n=1 Tax=Amycolatopsis anabasis TaxID=1840409 RepID=UPI00131E0527|nr:kelch repeat-containing protein [Amycolatopsis anabasis]
MRRTRTACLLATVLCLLVTAPGGPVAMADPAARWLREPPLPAPVQEVASVTYNGSLYVAGGFGVPGRGELFSAKHLRFDPASGRWTELAPLPAPAHHLQGVTVGGKIYYLAGEQGPFLPQGAVWEYDPSTNAFTERTPMPPGRERGAAGVAEHDGQIYVTGGLHDYLPTRMLDRYDPRTDTWTALPDMPTAREHLGAAFVGDTLYAVGGRQVLPGLEVTATEAFDVTTNRWRTGLAPIPHGRGGLAITALGGQVYAIGGEVLGGVSAHVEAYQPTTDTWQTLPPMPTPRHGIQAPAMNGKLWVAGGGWLSPYGPSDANEVFEP